MKLLIFVLHKVELLDKLLKNFALENVSGATIINTKGMVQKLLDDDDYDIIGSFRHLINAKKGENKTIFMAVKDEKVEQVVGIIEATVGSLDEPGTGILFTTPIDYIRGYKH